MANPRQRRKSRSSSHRAVSHSKHAKRNLKKTPPIRAPKILQQAWDKHKTVRQNYAALGLIHDLNPSESGGTEPIHVGEETTASECIDLTDSLAEVNTGSIPDTSSIAKKAPVPKGYGKIVRDENGTILRVELPEDESEEASTAAVDADVDMEQLEPKLDAVIKDQWVSDLGGTSSRLLANRNSIVVKGLQMLSTLPPPTVLQNQHTLSASLTGVGSRHTSEREHIYLQRLVEKYQDDVEAMARDRKLNNMQRTAGELRRALKRASLESGRE